MVWMFLRSKKAKPDISNIELLRKSIDFTLGMLLNEVDRRNRSSGLLRISMLFSILNPTKAKSLISLSPLQSVSRIFSSFSYPW